MHSLLPTAASIGALLKERHETIAVAESSSGGLVSAALLTVCGASSYFLGGAIVYTKPARAALAGIGQADMYGIRSASEAYAALLAGTMRTRLGATWGLTETGAAGPDCNRYGDAAGHTCLAVSGPVDRAMTVETGSSDRVANMCAFAAAALDLLLASLQAAERRTDVR